MGLLTGDPWVRAMVAAVPAQLPRSGIHCGGDGKRGGASTILMRNAGTMASYPGEPMIRWLFGSSSVRN